MLIMIFSYQHTKQKFQVLKTKKNDTIKLIQKALNNNKILIVFYKIIQYIEKTSKN